MWTYLKHDDKGNYLPGEEEKLPPEGASFQAFDSAGWEVSWGFVEQGHYVSMFPRARGQAGSDGVRLIAFAPWEERSHPDPEMIRASVSEAAFLAYDTPGRRFGNRVAGFINGFLNFYEDLRPGERSLVKLPFALLGGCGFVLLLCHLPPEPFSFFVAAFALLVLLVLSALLGVL